MSRLPGARILVVEDEPIVAMCLEDMLIAHGCVPVGPAGRLADGLALAESASIDAAILDINLAGERSDAIAAALSTRDIPFVFASGYDSAPAGFAAAAPMLTKPYRESDVARALAEMLG